MPDGFKDKTPEEMKEIGKRISEGVEKHYNKYGYRCLVVWGFELEDEETLVPELRAFVLALEPTRAQDAKG